MSSYPFTSFFQLTFVIFKNHKMWRIENCSKITDCILEHKTVVVNFILNQLQKVWFKIVLYPFTILFLMFWFVDWRISLQRHQSCRTTNYQMLSVMIWHNCELYSMWYTCSFELLKCRTHKDTSIYVPFGHISIVLHFLYSPISVGCS